MTKLIGFYSDRGAAGPEILLSRPHASRKISGLQIPLKPYRSGPEDNFDLGARL
jgi:hypothetical protein